MVTFGCGNEPSRTAETTSTDCKYGTPTPIFTPTLEQVETHSFSAQGQKGVEKIKFKNGTELELYQSGCDDLIQSYQFILDTTETGDDRYWVEKAVAQMRFLAGLSEEYLTFNLWANAIANNSEVISLGEAFEPEPYTFIMIDKIPSGDKTILVITLEAKS